MKVLFVGSLKKFTYSFYTYSILKKNYKKIDAINTDNFFFFKNLVYIVLFHLSPKLIEPYLNHIIKKRIKKKYDLIFVVTGELLGKKILKYLKKNNSKLVFLCLDNPFHNIDKEKWKLTLEGINLYDLVIFQQGTRIKYAKKLNLKYSLIPPLYNKKIHRPLNKNINKRKFKRDILLLGTWFTARGKFAKELIDRGLKFDIYGDNWHKDINYKYLKNFIKGRGVWGYKYSKLIYESKIVLSVPNINNDDDITNKSLEVPAIGSLLLTTDTKSHRKIFFSGQDVVFFKNAIDCYKKCKILLNTENRINKISIAGHKKITSNPKFDYEKNLIKLLKKVMYEK